METLFSDSPKPTYAAFVANKIRGTNFVQNAHKYLHKKYNIRTILCIKYIYKTISENISV